MALQDNRSALAACAAEAVEREEAAAHAAGSAAISSKEVELLKRQVSEGFNTNKQKNGFR